jgi:hypothetical protein
MSRVENRMDEHERTYGHTHACRNNEEPRP